MGKKEGREGEFSKKKKKFPVLVQSHMETAELKLYSGVSFMSRQTIWGSSSHTCEPRTACCPGKNGNSQRFLVLCDYGRIITAQWSSSKVGYRTQSLSEKWAYLVNSTQHVG